MSKTLVWGGGSCLKLLRPYLLALGRKPDFIFTDQIDDITPVKYLTKLNRPDVHHAALQCDSYVIPIGDSHGKRRSELSDLFRHEYGLKPLSLIHPTAFICPTAKIIDILRSRKIFVPVIGFPFKAGTSIERYSFESKVDCIALDWSVDLRWAITNINKDIAIQGNLDPVIPIPCP